MFFPSKTVMTTSLCENEIRFFNRLVDILSFVYLEKMYSFKIKTTLKGRHYHFETGNVKMLDFYARLK